MPREDAIPAEGTVVDRLPNSFFRVRLDETEHLVLAQLSGKIRKFSIRILLGDSGARGKVSLRFNRGRITYRHR